MPKNRREIDKHHKLSEILDSAERLLTEHGYQGTTVAAIARAAGIAPNAVYWYFPSKDHILTAVLERGHADIFAVLDDAESFGKNLEHTVETVLAVARQKAPLVDILRARAPESETVRAFRRGLHLRLRTVLAKSLKFAARSPRERELLAIAVMAVVEGALIYETPEFPAEDILKATLRTLTPTRNSKKRPDGTFPNS